MNEIMIALTAVHTLDRVMATATETERFIYRADDWFQAHVVPVVQKTAKEILLAAFVGVVRAAYLTFIAGQSASEWYLDWFSQYVMDVPGLVEEGQRMLPEVAYDLMPAKVAEKVVDTPKNTIRKAKNDPKTIAASPARTISRIPCISGLPKPAPRRRARASLDRCL